MRKISLITMVAVALGLGMGCADQDLEQGLDTAPITTTVPVPECTTEDSCTIDYRDGEWFVDGVQATSGECPAEDSCQPMYHSENSGWMFHPVAH